MNWNVHYINDCGISMKKYKQIHYDLNEAYFNSISPHISNEVWGFLVKSLYLNKHVLLIDSLKWDMR